MKIMQQFPGKIIWHFFGITSNYHNNNLKINANNIIIYCLIY